MNNFSQQLKITIIDLLQNCNSSQMPIICNMRSTPGGIDRIVAEVTNRIAKGGTSILESLAELESEFNNNKIED